MIDFVNQNSVIICYADFSFLLNPNRSKKDICIGIVSNMPESLSKGIYMSIMYVPLATYMTTSHTNLDGRKG